MKLKVLAAAVASAAAFSAHAAYTPVPLNDLDGASFISLVGDADLGFDLDGFSSAVFGISFNGPAQNISVSLYEGEFGDAIADTLITGATAVGDSVYWSVVDTGSYYLSVSADDFFSGKAILVGTATGSTPPVVSAVPEPDSYGMLLGGLGLIGFVMRRRVIR